MRPAALHWSAELRRQAKVQARERSKVDNEVEVGSAKCMPLPPKVNEVKRHVSVFFCGSGGIWGFGTNRKEEGGTLELTYSACRPNKRGDI